VSSTALRRVLSVGELSRLIADRLSTPEFTRIWIRGELGNVTIASSGHIYFSLKDDTAMINCVMFYGAAKQLKFRMEVGLKVELYGAVGVYEKRGQYQLKAERIIPEGMGELQLAFEQMKKRLLEEGLFDTVRKRPIPSYPAAIGIVTSPTGAAVKDILKATEKYFKNQHIIIYPSLVQGETAARSIVQAIQTANARAEVDVLIISRGGGSLEDLWPFNEESVARAISASRIPTISAVGHEVDTTIADFVADLRLATPTAAGEAVSRSKYELAASLLRIDDQLIQLLRAKLDILSEKISNFRPERLLVILKHVLESAVQRHDESVMSIKRTLRERFTAMKAEFVRHTDRLDALSPLKVLSRGYALVHKAGELVRSVSGLQAGDEVEIEMTDGKRNAEIK
jgi:exodeoxyribonuclease VII large subunit